MTKLLIEVQTANLYRDCDTFGKMDPYVVLESGSTVSFGCVILSNYTKVQTNPHKGGGKNPTWNQTLSITVTTDAVTMIVYDEDPGDDDIIGYGSIDVNTVIASGTYQNWVRINYQGKESGEVYIVASVDGAAATVTYATAMPTYAPAPTLYAPAPAVYAPAPTVYAPAPATYAYAPAPVYAPGYAPAPTYAAYTPAPAPVYTTMPGAPMYQTAPGVYTTAPASMYSTDSV